MKKNEEEDDDIQINQYKIVVLGDGSVGKTSFILRFIEDSFQMSYKQTIGVDFFCRRLELSKNVVAAMNVWDIGGQSIFGKMIPTYLTQANAIIFLYDITNYQSFIDISDWVELAKKSASSSGNSVLNVLVGNKCDLAHMQAVNVNKHIDVFSDKVR